MKYLVFDAGPLISLAMSGLLPMLKKLKKSFDGEFILTPDVKREVIDKPLTIKKYKLEAVFIKELINEGIFKMSKDLVSDSEVSMQTKKIMKDLNSVLVSQRTNERIKIIQDGEASCLAFADLCKGESLIVCDERTMRLLTESPKNLKELMERKLHVGLNMKTPDYLTKYNFIRSTELAYVAYKKNLLDVSSTPDNLDAVLYGLKFKGTAVLSEEIEAMKKLAKIKK